MIKKISFIILLIVSVSVSFAQKEISVISSDYNSLVIEYYPSVDTISEFIDFQKFFSIRLNGGKYPSVPGVPAVPGRIFNIGVPSESGNTIEVLQSSFKTINGRITPVPHLIKDNDISVSKYIIGENYYSGSNNRNLIDFDEFGYLREMPVQNIVVNPVEYDPEIQQIKIYDRILFRINFSRQQNISTSNKNDNFLENSVINYPVAMNWTKGQARINKVQFNSVLSTGKWFKFEAPDEGIYKIVRSQLSTFGIDAGTVDPRCV